MICWIFSSIVLGAAATAALAPRMRTAILALWVAGLFMGCVYLSLGAETLAVIQWIISTLVAISLFFFAVMFGEYERKESFMSYLNGALTLDRARILSLTMALILAVGFAFMIFLGASQVTPEMLALPKEKNDLTTIGIVLTKNHLLSLEVLSLTLFLILVGGGVIARPLTLPRGEEEGRGA
jgi:NADH:ubiquinone oxidoreductase subunit 6 (subunit J)